MCGGGYAPPYGLYNLLGATPRPGRSPKNFGVRPECQRPSAHQAAEPRLPQYLSNLPNLVTCPQAMLEDLVFRKVFQLLKIFGGSVECFLRNQPNNLST